MRIFVGCELSETAAHAVESLIDVSSQSRAEVKWVETKDFHLTVQYIGDADDAMVQKIEEALTNIVNHIKPFSFELKGTGAFPSMDRPRILWVGVGQGTEELRLCAKQVEGALEPLGLKPDERGFHAHVTIGRVRGLKYGRELVEMMDKEQDVMFGSTTVDRLVLFQSQLTPSGPIYTPLKRFPFAP